MDVEKIFVMGRASRDAKLHKSEEEGKIPYTTFGLNIIKGLGVNHFYEVSIVDSTAEAASQNIKRNDRVYVEGSLNFRPFVTKLGQQRLEIQIQADKWNKLR